MLAAGDALICLARSYRGGKERVSRMPSLGSHAYDAKTPPPTGLEAEIDNVAHF